MLGLSDTTFPSTSRLMGELTSVGVVQMDNAQSLVGEGGIISAADLRDFCRTAPEEDALLARLFASALGAVERRYALVLRPSTVTAEYVGACHGAVLPRGPVAAESALVVEALSADGVARTVDAPLLGGGLRPSITSAGGGLLCGIAERLRVTYAAGYAAGAVPPEVVQALCILTSDLYAHRETRVVGTVVARMPEMVDLLLSDLAPPAFG